MEFIVFLLFVVAAFAVWRLMRRAYLGARIRHLTRTGDPLIMDLHEAQMSRDWYSLDPMQRTSMAVSFQHDPASAYAAFASGGSDLQPAEFQLIMRTLIASDPACAHVRAHLSD